MFSRFFGAYVVPPGFYADGTAYTPEGDLVDTARDQARALGKSLAVLAVAVRASTALREAAPQV
jgi:hypothetical protein